MTTLGYFNYTHFPFLDYRLDEFQNQFTAEVPQAIQRIHQRRLGVILWHCQSQFSITITRRDSLF